MRIVKVVAVNSLSKQKETFLFGDATSGKGFLSCNLCPYLEFLFQGKSTCPMFVEVTFVEKEEEFAISRLLGVDGATRLLLKSKQNGRFSTVARDDDVETYLQAQFKLSLKDALRIVLVNATSVENFDGNLLQFSQFKLLLKVKKEVLQSVQNAKAQAQAAKDKVKTYAQTAVEEVTQQQISQTEAQIREVETVLAEEMQKLLQLKVDQADGALRNEIAQKLQDAQSKYNKLSEREQEIDAARSKVAEMDALAVIAPKIRALQSVAAQRSEQETKRYELTSELDWKEKELSDVVKQFDEKQLQFNALQDKRAKMEEINDELSYVSSLYEQNKKLNELLTELEAKQRALLEQRKSCLEKLANLEKSLAEVKVGLDAYQAPSQSVGELMETVRVDVKIDEVNAQLEKLQNEIAVKESAIAEKESGLVLQRKRFHSVAELDATVAPLKAKDTILQVLEAKYSKLEAINSSLVEKQRNLERALEDYNYKLSQINDSIGKLIAERNKALLRKQEEFKREVLLNSQKVFNEDSSSVFAVTANFQDAEIGTLEQEIESRNAERDLLVQRAAQAEGAIKEIKRHVEINSAEMETLRGEKENINKRYGEIVSQNSSEAVFNYLKALHNDSSTKYLLDVQQDAVRSEAELAEMKRSVESMRQKVSTLKTRLKYLQETQRQLEGASVGVDAIISDSDRMKENLADIGERLSLGYEQYVTLNKQLEAINTKLDNVSAAITETTKTVKVNEAQIRQSTAKAKRYAGTDNLEQAVTNFQYDLGDVESELQMLAESKQVLTKDVFEKRLELEKAQWLFEEKSAEYDELYDEIQPQLVAMGLDVERALAVNFDDVESLRKNVKKYDALKSRLSEKISNYYALLKNERSGEDVEKQQKVVEDLLQRQSELATLRQTLLQKYVAASTAKMKATAAAAEAKTLNSLKQTLAQLQIVSVLIDDKISALLSQATARVRYLLDENVKLAEKDGFVQVEQNGNNVDLNSLPLLQKAAVYTGLALVDSPQKKCIVFDENLGFNAAKLSALLQKTNDVFFVVEHKSENA